MSWVKVGAKCVCVSLPNGEALNGEADPVVRSVYTVRGLDQDDVSGLCGIYLEEIVNPPVRTFFGFHERAYNVAHFRPLISQADDVALFTHILDGLPIGEPA